MVVNFFTDADWFTFSPAEMVNFLAAINNRQALGRTLVSSRTKASSCALLICFKRFSPWASGFLDGFEML